MAEAQEGSGIAEKDGEGVINEDHEEDDDEDDEEGDGGFDHDAFEAGIRADSEKRHRALFGPLPTVKIPLELYKKAKDHQDQLTQEERALFLSRGDLIGKALAQPSSLTVEERNTILERQPLDKERANIELITNGQMSTIAELVSKTLTDVTTLSKNELELVSHNFNNDSPSSKGNFNDIPGASEAWCLLMSPEEQEAVMSALKYKAFGGVSLADRQAKDRQRAAEEKQRRAEFRRVNALHNAILERKIKLFQQRDALGEDEYWKQFWRIMEEENEGYFKSISSLYQPAFTVPNTSPEVQEQHRVEEIARRQKEHKRIMESNRHRFHLEELESLHKRGRLTQEEYNQQVDYHQNAIQLLLPPIVTRPLAPITSGLNSVYAHQPSLGEPWSAPPPATAYMLFANDQRERVRQENPDIAPGAIGKRLGELWKALSEEGRARYVAQAAAAAAANELKRPAVEEREGSGDRRIKEKEPPRT